MAPHLFTVVYAEDEPVLRKTVSTLLRSYGFIVYACQDGGEAVAACSKVRPHAVLLDCNMPGVDGFSAARLIRRLGCAQRIVALSGQPGARTEAAAAGCDRFLQKPVSAQALVQALLPPEI